METFFVPKVDKFLGRPITAMLQVMSKELSRIPTGELKLKTKNDLDHLISIAKDRTQWKRISVTIREAADASKSEH